MKTIAPCLLSLVFALLVQGCDVSNQQKDLSDSDAKSNAPQKSVYKTTPAEIYAAYEENEVAANKKIGDSEIEIFGVIQEISEDFAKDVVIRFISPNEFSRVSATLSKGQSDLAANLAKGQEITVRCKQIIRIIGSPVAQKCALVETQKAPPIKQDASVLPTAPQQSDANQRTVTQSGDIKDTRKESIVKPSFDCAKAKSDAEKLVCSDTELAERDNSTLEAYLTAKSMISDSMTKNQYDAFMAENKSRWLEREKNCHDKKCVMDWYDKRSVELQGWITAAGTQR
ncbi:MAG: hypothetical protein KGM99_16105 [Burkholderiales bacterium]|nr:hypothetical protein [Burkholderiales bacterium]